ncbi:hypothetical protein BBO99_00008254 [Phytophthora kernoviae]|uniref:HIG1 domain-containing protein n=1 Tax=Phytophthora kernoviae TaxID=325452 RepID=A0A3R7IEB2_9STRA|nr:hypothetical protein JM18_007972 [Phytophthora kernoviae]KAG2521209.1 hypothetical protein JM16_006369 [Phytophthora kernoviae]RLM96144.1 hypothetical protein BBI17_008223 [Phytophthora kernoviae]RLN75542.1 hypothetical protein BBO99_00008254 [Phytophthora kernoviae]
MSAVADNQQQEHSSWAVENPNKARDAITWDAYKGGIRAGAVAAAVSAVAVLSANKYWPAFRSRLSVSGKTALVVSPFLGAFTLVAETRLMHGVRNPELYMATMDGSYVPKQQEAPQLKLWQRGANFLYDHPYRCLVTVGAPLVAGIYGYQHMNKGISASQQIMHTRIYGQASVVVLLLSSMAFHDYMAKRGKFETLVVPLPQGVELPRSASASGRRRTSSGKKKAPIKPALNTNANTNRPDSSRMTQQELHMWQPVLTLGWSIGICFTVALICIALGVAIVYTSGTLTKLRVVYDGDEGTQASDAVQLDGNISLLSNCRLDSPDDANSFHANHTCYVSLTLPNDIRSPVRIFYELDMYYQNHRRFVSSVIREQFTDEWRPDAGYTMIECPPMKTVVSELCSVGDCEDPETAVEREYFPCGIVANTMFNDIFWLHEGVLPSGKNLTRTDIVSKGIARNYAAHNNKNPTWNLSTEFYLPVWLNPKMSRIIPPPGGPTAPHITENYTNSTAWVHDALDADFGVGTGVENEFWRVWVEGAAMHPFRKPYGRIEQDLPAGTTLVFAVQSNFFVRTFSGSKALILEEVGWFGSANYVLGVFFLVIGGIFLVAAIFFTGRKLHSPRTLGDAAALVWKRKKAQ